MISRRNFCIRLGVISLFALMPFFTHQDMRSALPKAPNKQHLLEIQKQANLGNIKAKKIISALSEGRQDGLENE
ncbi:hypothetical protein ZMO1_ZMO1464 [Zymomonas mobilis subsp. mobilis ZM4 = ATCC 31821]|uniref:Uncharacterized protein n=2 Tax=Zymomonas mobilis subsp. mobilis TaxID=120045 RepID=Q5NMH2_ZYMMO|nr:hypothetical protein [Zymomonas mobilis]ACV76262.1 hypothetical protein Za10_1728 [Zymomonas mobilis subsp. mobilis NCIMB 11163]AEH63462.1 conserved hypothetical protein [Zymomonas mobilis subsp. mobilis ATCC 10988]AHB10945.1 hypothetical protein ZCP4_1675 [Zymomonas mobilis subsp. mobilis str. CP4 = NRRL B-14023]AHJ71257.1 hypothetical protein A254_01673 [Zymomonas mobilis subsp. mobilis NRRL B-12526]AAV90088.2 hypothetical protein ZMO1464 [Zymomonas mobilis subsp. mobilis ZM4 = ATCC 31821